MLTWTVPWGVSHAGTKRALAWEEPAGQRVPKPRKGTSSSKPAEIITLFTADGDDLGDMMLLDAKPEKRPQGCEEEEEGGVQGFHGQVPRITKFSSDMLNGNVLSGGKFAFAEWLIQNRTVLDGRRILELKSGKGDLAIFLRKALGVDITTSDFDVKEVQYNIAYNCNINDLAVLPHIPPLIPIVHDNKKYPGTWGDPFPVSRPDWDIVIASDIETYAGQSPKLVKTLCFLLKEYKQRGQKPVRTTITNKSGTQVPVTFPIALISWRQRIDPSALFLGCQNEGMEVQHLGYFVYLIKK
ncbi:hypothetical protein U9M48_011047 [Paspalum notatum var. saurae]|uniref:S-adenosyl-L-methionine-dependent methyltransferase superfamily protein n=1 Tax=Paspalum notatum var. saurae TaxID=547442 RepID=A0AAQ3SW43_PASNO